ncbi:class I SAM-dependent methyltransferase [Microcoleus sp. SVA1_B6]|uniref:class I SAM-dependent methyltransferase n=1 Tax=unclassified Microcoleus TaxID=2642155 RepID=UPI002FD770D8
MAENSRSLYNNWAFAYPVSKEGIELWLDFMQEHILKHLPKEAHILDIGCGKGEIVKSLIEKGYQVTGLDISEEMLRYASENVPNGKFIRDDIRFCKLPPNFDAVLSSNNVFSYIYIEFGGFDKGFPKRLFGTWKKRLVRVRFE